MREESQFRVVVMGGSAGGMEALTVILSKLSESYPLSIAVVQHLHKTDGGRFAEHLGSLAAMTVEEVMDKVSLSPGRVFVAPADFHLLVERDGTLSLSVDPKVNWARPSIDVLFESAARAFGEAVIGVILSGANDDGARGIKLIGDLGGFCIAQDPDTATSPFMPRSAITRARIDAVLAPPGIGDMLDRLAGAPSAGDREGGGR